MLAHALASTINVLSILFGQVYFPTYTNGLKDLAKWLGFEWSDPRSSGLQSLIWRTEWEGSRDPAVRTKLIRYNAEDCDALALVLEKLTSISSRDPLADHVVRVESMKRSVGSKWKRFESPIPALVEINDTAHWSYQRDRVVIRSGDARARRQIFPKHKSRRLKILNIALRVPEFCPRCGSIWKSEGPTTTRVVEDLLFGRDSIKRRRVCYSFQTNSCRKCGSRADANEMVRKGTCA